MINFLKYTLITLFSVFLISSCSKDDEFDPVGTWRLVDLETTGCNDADFNSLDFMFTNDDGLCAEQDNQSFCVDITFVFSGDGTVDINSKFNILAGGIMLSDMDMTTGTWTQTETSLEVCADNECQNISITASDDRITLSQYDEDLECTLTLVIEKQ